MLLDMRKPAYPQQATLQIVSTGQDGAVFLANPTATTSADQFRAARPTASYTAVKWASQMTFVTAGTTGEIPQ